MAGYSYYHISMRSQISGGQPFAPFVPSQFNCNDPPQGYVTKKKIVPVASRPYHDSDDDDDEWKNQRQTSPPRGHPSNTYGDYIGNKQSIGSTINKPDGYYNNGISYGKKEGTKPSSVDATKNDNHDGYNSGYGGRKPPTESSSLRPNNKYDGTNYGYGDYGGGNKEGRNPVEIPVKDNYGGYGNPAKKDNYGAYGGYENPAKKDDHGAYGNPVKENDYGAYGNPVKKDNYGAYGGYENPAKKDNYGAYGNPVKKDDHGAYGGYENPAKKDNYGAYGGYGSPAKKDNYAGYGGYEEGPKSKPKPSSSPIYNNGYGQEKPFGRAMSPIGDSGNEDNGNKGNPYYNNKLTPGWSASSRNGNTKLSRPTDNIDVAIRILEDEAANRGYNGGHKQLESKSDNNPHQRTYDGPGPLPSRRLQVDKKGMDLGNETERLKKINLPVIKDNRGRISDYEVINHEEAVKRFNGMDLGNETERLKKIDVPVIKDNRGRISDYEAINHEEAVKRFNGMKI